MNSILLALLGIPDQTAHAPMFAFLEMVLDVNRLKYKIKTFYLLHLRILTKEHCQRFHSSRLLTFALWNNLVLFDLMLQNATFQEFYKYDIYFVSGSSVKTFGNQIWPRNLTLKYKCIFSQNFLNLVWTICSKLIYFSVLKLKILFMIFHEHSLSFSFEQRTLT